MRIVSLSIVLLSLFAASAQEGKKEDQQQNRQKIPTTLAEAHAELERMLSPQVLAEIDALPSENDMIQYHMSLGLMIRNGWGLWGDSPLAKYMRELGFTHPDYMSGAILSTFWRKRHGQDVNLEELKAVAKKEAEADEIKDAGSRVVAQPDLRPNTILVLDDQSYVIGSRTWHGVYLLRKGTDGQRTCRPVEDVRDIVVW